MRENMCEIEREGYWTLEASPVVTFDVDELPVDEWKCADCNCGVGYQLGPQDVPNLGWTEVYCMANEDPLNESTKKYCADCAKAEGI